MPYSFKYSSCSQLNNARRRLHITEILNNTTIKSSKVHPIKCHAGTEGGEAVQLYPF
jgi:hypothetical protein